MGPSAPLSFGAFGPKTYSYLSLEKEIQNISLCIKPHTGRLSSYHMWRALLRPLAPLSFGAFGPKTYPYSLLENESQNIS